MDKYRVVSFICSDGSWRHRIEQKFFKLFWCQLGTYRGYGEGAYFVPIWFYKFNEVAKEVKELINRVV